MEVIGKDTTQRIIQYITTGSIMFNYKRTTTKYSSSLIQTSQVQ